jgi:hypothetical protein
MIFLEEWNSSAIFVIFALAFFVTLIIYVLLSFVLRFFGFYLDFIDFLKKKSSMLYISYEILFFIFCGFMFYIFSYLSTPINP